MAQLAVPIKFRVGVAEHRVYLVAHEDEFSLPRGFPRNDRFLFFRRFMNPSCSSSRSLLG
jgi:hypothetical protein